MKLCGEQEERVSNTTKTESKQKNEVKITRSRSNVIGGSQSLLAKHVVEALTTDLHPYQTSDRFIPLFER